MAARGHGLQAAFSTASGTDHRKSDSALAFGRMVQTSESQGCIAQNTSAQKLETSGLQVLVATFDG